MGIKEIVNHYLEQRKVGVQQRIEQVARDHDALKYLVAQHLSGTITSEQFDQQAAGLDLKIDLTKAAEAFHPGPVTRIGHSLLGVIEDWASR